ncbi:MAG TPA: ParB/RepB/Spo0J family partition protein [Myxococcaceae bacterium]|nr:ParB/RepB/Spo0J family partition protein [Myxococcaceae bacterium]
METREHEMTSDPPEERSGPESGPGEAPSSPEALDADGSLAADTAMPTLPPRVEPAPAPRLERPPETEERLISLDALDEDHTFQLRSAGDVGRLAMDLARLGQAFPVDVRQREGTDRYQLVAGFRRVAALRFLQRTSVLARVHARLSDEDALLVALAGVLHGAAPTPEELAGLEARLAEEGRLSAAARDMLDRAQATDDGLAPESAGGEEEVDADELASELTGRMGELNQDLALLAPVFDALEPGRRAELLQQLRYVAELVAYFEEES